MIKMKDSEIEWIGEIPEDWKMVKVKNIFTSHKNVVGKKEEKYERLALTLNGVLKRPKEDTKGLQSETLSTYQILNKDELVFKMIDLANINTSRVGYSHYTGIVSPVYIILNNYKYSKFGYYYFYNMWQREIFNYLGNDGVRSALNATDMLNLPFPKIAENESKKIVCFLDTKITEIDNIIERTKGIIKDYKLYKQSIITKAVTNGLNKNIEMKDCGIEWIGNIPKNWNTIKIKYTSWLKGRIGWQGLTSNEYIEKGPYLITGTDFKNGIIDWNSCVHISKERFVEDTDIHIKENDLLITKDGTVGKVAIAKNCPKEVSLNSGVLLIRNTKKYKYNEKYLYYILLSKQFTRWYQLSQTGNSTIKHLYQEQFYNFEFTYPPMDEQIEICNYLDRKVEQINKLIEIKEKTLEELSNYKKSLIYEYVTGKKEVKENQSLNRDNIKGIKINCKDNIFAQAILLCRIIEKLNNYNLGRVKAEKTLYLIEKDIGFDFENNYAREAAGPLCEAIYKCESVISKKNKWIKVNKVKKHIEYEILSDFDKYNKYYEKYYSGYDNQIENIIDIIKDYSTDKAEMVATLYASWNDFIIKKETVSDIKIVRDVRENWNDTKKRFNEKKWLDVLEEMKKIGLAPKGNGNLTIVKEQ